MVRVRAAKQVRQLPEKVEHSIRRRFCTRTEERKLLLEIERPPAQIEMIVRIEPIHRRVSRHGLEVEQRRAPLIPGMPVQVQERGLRKLPPQPGQTKIDPIALEHGALGGRM